jgi:hypothetical protein
MKVKIQFEVLEESTNIKTVAMWDWVWMTAFISNWK